MKCSRRWQALNLNWLVALFLLFLFFPLPSLSAVINLKDEAEVKEEEILLKDLAEIDGTKVERELLSSIPIGKAPRPCREKSISKREVANRIVSFLKRNGLSLEKIEIRGAPLVKVKRACVKITKEHIEELVEQFLKKNYPDVVILSVPSVRLELPSGNFKEELSLESIGKSHARFVYKVYSEDGELLKKLWLPVRIDRKVKVIVARLTIPKGSLIKPQMVEEETLPLSKARYAFQDLNQVIGKIARQTIPKGEVIKEKMLSPNYVVRKGNRVKVIYERGAIRIELYGLALDSGSVGNIIRVKNVSTGKILRCRVEKDGSVRFVSD